MPAMWFGDHSHLLPVPTHNTNTVCAQQMLISLIKGSVKALGTQEVMFHLGLEGNLVGAEMGKMSEAACHID